MSNSGKKVKCPFLLGTLCHLEKTINAPQIKQTNNWTNLFKCCASFLLSVKYNSFPDTVMTGIINKLVNTAQT